MNASRKSRLWIVLLLLSLAVVWLGARLLDREPRFEGRSLSEWLEDTTLSYPEMRRGVRSIGTNGIPFFKYWVDFEETWLERQVRELNSRQRMYDVEFSPTVDAHLRAIRGFLELEELAAGELDWLVTRWQAQDHNHLFYTQLLSLIGDPGLAVLTNSLPAMNEVQRKNLASAWVSAARRKPALMEPLRLLLNDPSENVRVATVYLLWGSPGELPEEFVVALNLATKDESERVRLSARAGLLQKMPNGRSGLN